MWRGKFGATAEDVPDQTSRNAFQMVFGNLVGIVGAVARLAADDRNATVGVGASEFGWDVEVKKLGNNQG